MGDSCIKTNVNLKEFEKCAADRTPLGVIAKDNGATITRMGMDGKMQTVEANPGDKVYKGDIIKTPPNGSVAITLPDKSVISAGPNSTVDMARFDISSNWKAPEGDEVKRGSLSTISGKIAPASTTPTNYPSSFSMGGVRG